MSDDQSEAPAKRHRGIYLLPNLFTTAALFAGFYAIVAAMGDRFEAAGAIYGHSLLLSLPFGNGGGSVAPDPMSGPDPG